MDNALKVALENVVSAHGYACGVAASASGKVLARVGDCAGLGDRDLEPALFGDEEAIVRLYGSLEGKMLPQMAAQGDVRCCLMKPKEGIVVGVFVESSKDNVQLYLEFRSVSQELDAQLAGVDVDL